MEYKNYIIKENDYPHPTLKYIFYHKDDTDGNVIFCKTIEECKEDIDYWIELNNSF